MLHTKFRFISPSRFREEDLKKSANQKQELPMVTTLPNELKFGRNHHWKVLIAHFVLIR
jgi:hypothetical protein